jgi:hypothetical protein
VAGFLSYWSFNAVVGPDTLGIGGLIKALVGMLFGAISLGSMFFTFYERRRGSGRAIDWLDVAVRILFGLGGIAIMLGAVVLGLGFIRKS